MGLDRESVGVRMSLVYNNDKPIGKCESYSIDKVPGTTPFVMLTNYEPLRSELNENQQVVLEWLKDDFKESGNPVDSLESLASEVLHVETFQTCISSTYDELSISEQFQVLQAFAEWGMKEVAE